MKISKREKTLAMLAGGTVILLLYYMVILSPWLTRQEALNGHIRKREQSVKEMNGLKQEWEVFQAEKNEADASLNLRGKAFTLLSYLESVSRQAGIDKKIQYMKPLSLGKESDVMKPEGIEVKLEGITVDELINLIYQIEYSGKLLNMRRMKIQRSPKGNQVLLNATLQVQTYRSQSEVKGG